MKIFITRNQNMIGVLAGAIINGLGRDLGYNTIVMFGGVMLIAFAAKAVFEKIKEAGDKNGR